MESEPIYCSIHHDVEAHAQSIGEIWERVEDSQAIQSFGNACTNCRAAFERRGLDWDCSFWRDAEGWQPGDNDRR
jgi:hypothetical protein